MIKRQSRTYRLRLSPAGTALFLTCHSRLAHLTGTLIPYGTTLFVAILLADALDSSDIIAELELPSVKRLSGDSEHYVGAWERLGEIGSSIRDRIESSDLVFQRPRMALVHMACLALMSASDDKDLLRAYEHMNRLMTER